MRSKAAARSDGADAACCCIAATLGTRGVVSACSAMLVHRSKRSCFVTGDTHTLRPGTSRCCASMRDADGTARRGRDGLWRLVVGGTPTTLPSRLVSALAAARRFCSRARMIAWFRSWSRWCLSPAPSAEEASPGFSSGRPAPPSMASGGGSGPVTSGSRVPAASTCLLMLRATGCTRQLFTNDRRYRRSSAPAPTWFDIASSNEIPRPASDRRTRRRSRVNCARCTTPEGMRIDDMSKPFSSASNMRGPHTSCRADRAMMSPKSASCSLEMSISVAFDTSRVPCSSINRSVTTRSAHCITLSASTTVHSSDSENHPRVSSRTILRSASDTLASMRMCVPSGVKRGAGTARRTTLRTVDCRWAYGTSSREAA
mmetsp:Transcript_35966/g.110815  ORF Transcript_35966/g.110815 Transcript_35966/m.110815 type:complete len:372 (+) Transcript_35966:275-1390(+)